MADMALFNVSLRHAYGNTADKLASRFFSMETMKFDSKAEEKHFKTLPGETLATQNTGAS